MLVLADFSLQEQPEDNLMVAISPAWYNGSYPMANQPIKSLELHYTMIQFLIKTFITPILKSLVILAIWLALNSAIYSQIAPYFALNRILSLAHQNGNGVTKIAY